jgi:hypothetical protein
VLFFDYYNPKDSLKACVKTCPTQRIETNSDFNNFTIYNGNLCLYDVVLGTYDTAKCPKIPIPKTYDLLSISYTFES